MCREVFTKRQPGEKGTIVYVFAGDSKRCQAAIGLDFQPIDQALGKCWNFNACNVRKHDGIGPVRAIGSPLPGAALALKNGDCSRLDPTFNQRLNTVNRGGAGANQSNVVAHKLTPAPMLLRQRWRLTRIIKSCKGGKRRYWQDRVLCIGDCLNGGVGCVLQTTALCLNE